MKKPKQKRKHTNTLKKVAPAQASAGSPAVSKRKFVVAGLAAAAVLVVAGAFAYDALTGYPAPGSGKQPQGAAAGGSQYFEQAKVRILKEDRELGTMRVSDERTAQFSMRNVGGKPLEISQVRTSCMCTLAQVIIDDEQSPIFNMEMHNSPSVQRWKGVIEPGLTATIRVIYRPSLMPVEGSIARNVKFNTNDPSRPVVELGIHATVQ
jgi:hypothetical protein